MQLNRLHIWRGYNDVMKGEIEVAGETGKITLSVNETLCHRLVETCATELVEVARGIARDMTAEMISVAKISAPKETDQ